MSDWTETGVLYPRPPNEDNMGESHSHHTLGM